MEGQTDIQQQAWEDLVIRPAPETPKAAPLAQQAKPEMPASYLTHELRAPVTAIRLGLEILQEQIDTRLRPEERQMLAVAVRNTTRLESLVNDIMDYSKMLAGKLEVHKEACDPRELVREAAESMRSVALAQGVKLVVDDGEPLPRVSAEAGRIVQILTNLLSNAIKFTPARGRVTVSCEMGKREHKNTILFKVKDTGRGIKPEDLERIFDMFAQSQAANLKKCEGTGLGLTLARLMVGLHGGRIWADSWHGVGATFCFTIPIASEDMCRKAQAYPREVEYHGVIVSLARRVNAFLALFV